MRKSGDYDPPSPTPGTLPPFYDAAKYDKFPSVRKAKPKNNNGGASSNTPSDNTPSDNTPSKTKSVGNKQQKQSDIAAADYHQQRSSQDKNSSQTYGASNQQKGHNKPKGNQQHSDNNPSAARNNSAGGNWECSCCKRAKFHELSDCKEFVAKTQNDRFLFLKANGLCHKCLARGHLAKECRSEIGCDHCPGKFHHSLMHREFRSQKENEGEASDSDDSSDESDHHE